MLLFILRCLRGYVEFSVIGSFPERLINICLRNRIRVWEVCRRGDEMTARMYLSDYRRIRSYARSSGVRTRILSRSGIPPYLRRCSDRVGIFAGAGVFVLTVFVMSLFVWSIDITGLDTVSESRMRALLREEGLYIGAFKPSFDDMSVSRAVMLKENRIGWMAVNVSGSYASVEVKEQTPPPEVADIAAPCNVKAKRDGVILSIEAGEGKTVILEGSGVLKDQLIVSGVMEDARGGSRLVHAGARVIAQTTYTAEFSVPAAVERWRPTGESNTRVYGDLFGIRIPLSFGGLSGANSINDTSEERPAPLGISLPIGRVNETVSVVRKERTSLDENSAEELLTLRSDLYETFVLSDCTVTDRESRLSFDDDTYFLTVTYTCTEDIAYQDPIGADNIE